MTQFLKPSFTVSQRGRDPDQPPCEHGMIRPKDGACCFCGAPAKQVALDHAIREARRTTRTP